MGIKNKQFVDAWKHKLNKIQSTYRLQVESLRSFLDVIGYECLHNSKTHTWHICRKRWIKSNNPDFISLDLAVALHNGNCLFRTGDSLWKLGHSISVEGSVLQKAHKEKIVETIYLQRNRGEWVAQKHLIKFNEPESMLEEDTY